jgi:hypothetical protein
LPIKYSTYHIYGDARKAREVAPELMLGVELVNGLREATIPVIKSAHFSTPWTYLPKKQCCIVFFHKNLGQATIPSLPIRLCSGNVIPSHRGKDISLLLGLLFFIYFKETF